MGRARRRPRRGAARRRRPGDRRATTCARSAATARTCSPSPRRRSSTEKSVTGRDAWTRLFSELTSAIARRPRRRRRRGRAARRRPQPPGLARPRGPRTTSPRRSPRRCSRALRTRAYIFNTLLADKATDDRLRHYPTWLSSRNLANEASDESVQALVDAVRAQLRPARSAGTRLKARLLGVDRLADYDRMASVADDGGPGRVGRGERARARLLRRVLPDPGRRRAALLRRALDRRARAPGQARRRVLRLHGAERAPLRDAQLDGEAPRRADARPRARPRPARLAGDRRAGRWSRARR